MNKLTEIKNHKVVYDGKDGKLLLPLNFSAIKEMAPWIEQQSTHQLNRIKGSSGFPYIFLTNNRSYIILDTGSKVPTLYSGNYQLFSGKNNYNSESPHKLFSDKKEITELLKLKYTPKQRIQFDMPYTEKELIGYARKNQFAKAVYDIVKMGATTSSINKLDNFLGDYVVLEGDSKQYSDSGKFESIEYSEEGINLFTPDDLYRERYLNIDDDSSWVFNAAMYDYSDCEEMETDELQYIDHYMTKQTNEKFVEIIRVFEPDYLKENPISDSGLPSETSEGAYDTFLQEYFENDWESDSWEVLEAVGCAVYRSRKESVLDVIQSERTYHFDVGPNDIINTQISYRQLLQLIGTLDLNNFSELRENDINELDINLSDDWYDAWDIDDDGIEEINYAMMSILNKLYKKYEDSYDSSKVNQKEFEKLMEFLHFKSPSYGYGGRNTWSKDLVWPGQDEVAKIIIRNFNAMDNTVTINLGRKDNVGWQKDYDVKNIANELTNLPIPFPEEDNE